LLNLSNLIGLSEKTKAIKEEDKWIISKLNSLIKKVSEELENLHPQQAARSLQNFWLNNLSRGYVQLVRDRISSEEREVKGVLQEIYVQLVKLCAPFIPFISENAWQELKKKKMVAEESVHLCGWPQAEKNKINLELEKEFEIIFEIIEKGLAERDKEKIGLKWPLSKAILTLPKDCKLSEEEKEIVVRQLNVKKIEIKIGNEISVSLDAKMTAELEAEGYSREFARYVQDFRKKSGLNKKDVIELKISTDKDLKDMLEKHISFLKERVNAKSIKFSEDKLKNYFEFEIKSKKVSISFS